MKSKTTIKRDRKKGRGLYATEAIREGEVIEECEVILIPMEELPPSLEPYVYEFSEDQAAIALGNGSLLNHSDDPNSDFQFNYKKKILIIKATRAINSGEEIMIDYGYDEEARKKFKIS